MSPQDGGKDLVLDDAIAAVRDDAPAPGAAEAAAARVWPKVSPAAGAAAVETIGGCADVLALLPDHRKGALAPARRLLVDDHLRECVACRAASLATGRSGVLLAWRPAGEGGGAAAAPARSWRSYARAASVVLALAAAAVLAQRTFFGVPAGSRAAVQAVSGGLQRVSASEVTALAPGQEIGEGEPVRTGRASRAVLRLRDGSLVEMGERAELSVTARGTDTTIHLARGQVIVQAARRRTGHLRVASGDATVSVTGTVFSVNHGLKGSRVSVFEGSVRVASAVEERTLAPGDQWASAAGVDRVPLKDEIAWSADVDRHLALLAEVKVLRDRLRAVPTPGLRYVSRLLPLVPAEVVLFASTPNYGQALAEAGRVFQERLRESAVLRRFWAEADPARQGGPDLGAILDRVRTFSSFLGDEVVLVVTDGGARRRLLPVVMAEVRQPGLVEFLEGELARVPVPPGHRIPVVILGEGGSGAPDAREGDVYILVRSGFMAVGLDRGQLQELGARFEAAPSGGLDTTPFGARIAEAYGDGVGLFLAADLQRMTSRFDPSEARGLHRTGLDGIRYLVFERKQVADEARTQALLSFDGAPRGIASWLGAPGAMGSLEFVSPSAEGAAVVLAKSPAAIFDDVLAMATVDRDGARKDLADFESKIDVRLREDVAETLGGEFALALDGPILPTPAWKAVVEVNDPGRLQSALERLVRRASEIAPPDGRPALVLESESAEGQLFHTIRGGGLPFEVHYAFADGYLVAAPSRALVMRALATRASGDSLARSERFRALFPPDRDVNVSAVVYQNLAPLVGGLLEAPGAGALSGDQRRSIQGLASDARPSVLCAYAEPEAVRVSGLGGVFDLDASELTLPVLLGRVMSGTGAKANP